MKTMMLSLAATIALTGAALAHSKSETTVPADGANVEAVEEVVLRFNMPMRVTRVVVTGEAGEIATSSEMGTDPVTEYVATPEDEIAPGAYEVDWRGLSADGHPMQGGFTFTVSQ